MRVTDTESFKKYYTEKFKGEFDYSNVIYNGVRNKVKIGCKIHGIFEQTPEYHKNKGVCPFCQKESVTENHKDRLTVTDLLNQFKLAHGDTYDYSKVNKENYKNGKIKIPIICRKHGEFKQEPSSHKKGVGCPKCIQNYRDKDGFIKKAIEKGLDKNISFEKVKYVNSYTNVTLTCRIHNVDFDKRPDNFLNHGGNCPECSRLTFYKSDTLELKLKEVYEDVYHFPELEKYKGIKDKIKGICKKYGSFRKRTSELLQGNGCPKCSNNISKPEIEIQDYVRSLGLKIITNKKTIIQPLELDIYLPSLNKAIEFNGKYWHYSDKYFIPGKHAKKSNLCREKGIKLLHIREDLWKKDQEKMKKVIINFLT